MQQRWLPQLCDPANFLGAAIMDDPGGVWSDFWRSLWDPIAADWNDGNYGRAAGRVGAMVAEAVLGSKGAGNALRASRVTGHTPKPCSFSAGTLVLMADGTTKLISEIEPGDLVLAADPETGEQTAQTVVAVWVHDDTLVDLQILQTEQVDAGIVHANNGVILGTVSTTADHPFWNHTHGQWQPAEALAVSDQLYAVDGTRPIVVGLLARTRRATDAYNLTTASIHTYYVMAGKTPVLVHNADGGDLPGREEARLDVMRRAGIPLDATPIDTLSNASGVQYVYDVNGRYMLVTENTMDRSHPGQPHWEAGPMKRNMQVDNHGRYRVSNNKVKANFTYGGC
jgi:hypothetical protein